MKITIKKRFSQLFFIKKFNKIWNRTTFKFEYWINRAEFSSFVFIYSENFPSPFISHYNLFALFSWCTLPVALLLPTSFTLPLSHLIIPPLLLGSDHLNLPFITKINNRKTIILTTSLNHLIFSKEFLHFHLESLLILSSKWMPI